MVWVIRPYVGPASSPATMRKVVAPVTSSPAQIACCTGAAPRQAGSSEKCRLTQPCGGIASAESGQQGAVGDDRAAVRAQLGELRLEVGLAGMARLQHRHVELFGELGHRGGDEPTSTTGRCVGAGDDADQVVPALRDRPQGRQGGLGRAGEDDAHC